MNKNIKILFKSMKNTLRAIADFSYIILFIALTIYSFLNTVQLNLDWEDLLAASEGIQGILLEILLAPQLILLVNLIIQYLCSEEYNWKEYVLAILICIFSYPVQETADGAVLVSYVLLILGARNFSFRYLMRIYFGIVASLTILVVFASQVGWVENLVFVSRDGRAAYGFVYATDCAAHFLFLALVYWYLRGEGFHYAENIIFGIFALIACFGCKARFSTALLLLLIIVAFVYRLILGKLGKERRDQLLSGKVSAFFVLFPLMANLLIHVLSFIYTDKWKWLVSLDQLLSSRLSLAKRGLDIYGLDLWGNRIRMLGNGGRTEIVANYYFIDSSYLQISMLHGVILLGVFLLLIFLVCLKARRQKEWIVLIICGFIVVHGLFEHHAFDLAYNPFLLMAFSKVQPVKCAGKSLKRKAKKR